MNSHPHLVEWQRRSFAVSSGNCPPQQTADAHRAHLLAIQYAWAAQTPPQPHPPSPSPSPPLAIASLLRTYSERYAAVLDSDDPANGLNNYAEAALHLARMRPNHSGQWESSVTRAGLRTLPCVQEFLDTLAEPAGKSPAMAADVNLVVGGESRGSDRGNTAMTSTSGGRGDVPDEAGAALGLATRGQQGGAGGAPSPTRRGADGATGWGGPRSTPPPLLQRAQPGPTPLFGHVGGGGNWGCQPNSLNRPSGLHPHHTSSSTHPPHHSSSSTHPPHHTSSFTSSSKRKTFLSSTADNKTGYHRHDALDGRGGGGRGRGAEAGGGSFKTAHEQLLVDQHKKNCHQPPRQQTSGWAAATKKSLGANRPRGTFSKFVSPVPKPQEEGFGGGGASGEGQDPQITDERLKNFEPKIIELIMSEIMDHGPPVAWDDIAGLEFAKATIKEIVVWPMLRPDIFTGLRGPPKGILLFGPPGTGKTLIGKCIASQSGATFFSISASSLTSKWVGEGEKMVRALFAIARCHQPAVIFIDEIDSLLSQRVDGEHDSSRRIKTEFLVQLDGAATSADDRILVVGATNRPQEIDEAARRRLAKRLYIPLPEAPARRKIVTNLMSREKSDLHDDQLDDIVGQTEGFSGADMTQLCREAALGPIRSLQFDDMATITAEQVRPITHGDFLDALGNVRPSVSCKDLELYEDWNRTFGCGR